LALQSRRAPFYYRAVIQGGEGRLLRPVVAAVLLAVLAATAAVAHPDINFVEQEVDKMVAANPGDPELLIHQAQVRQRASNFDGALVSLALALAHGGDRDAVATARGAVFLAAGFPQMAAFEYGTVLAHRPDAYDVLFERAAPSSPSATPRRPIRTSRGPSARCARRAPSRLRCGPIRYAHAAGWPKPCARSTRA
jgi:hypothetical protein